MSERFLLEVIGGPLSGQTYSVPSNGALVIGRLPECGMSIPQDLTVSRQHCRIEFHPPECRLIHLSQTGETLLNDISVASADLRSGDVLSFGTGNRVRVRLDNSPADIEAAAPRSQIDPSAPTESNRFTMAAASCGWTAFQSAGSQPDFGRLLQILIKSQPVYALIDFRRIGHDVPAELAKSDYLFTWLPPEQRPQFSPMLVSISASPIAADAIRAGWGHDGIVCFGSPKTAAELLMHWQTAIGAKADAPGPSLTVYYWPVLLTMMLKCQSAEQLAPLLTGLDWLFMEAADSPGNWTLYAVEQFADVLNSAGLLPVEK